MGRDRGSVRIRGGCVSFGFVRSFVRLFGAGFVPIWGRGCVRAWIEIVREKVAQENERESENKDTQLAFASNGGNKNGARGGERNKCESLRNGRDGVV